MHLFGSFALALLMFVLVVLTLAILIDCWRRGNLEMSTKFMLTQLYVLSWTLLFMDGWGFLIGQMLLALLLEWVTVRSLRGTNHNGDHQTVAS